MIKVLLVNEQRLFNEAIESLLSTEADMEVVGAVTNGRDVVKHIEIKEPDVILLDAHLTSADGIKLTVTIKEKYPHISVILLTSFSKRELVIAGIIAGADGFLLKNIDAANLLYSIRNAYDGQIIISGEAAKILAKKVVELKYDRHDILKQRLANRNILLSDRELDVALLMLDKLTNQEMAKQLFLSEGTIKNYVSEIYSKLHVVTRKEAVNYLQSMAILYYK